MVFCKAQFDRDLKTLRQQQYTYSNVPSVIKLQGDSCNVVLESTVLPGLEKQYVVDDLYKPLQPKERCWRIYKESQLKSRRIRRSFCLKKKKRTGALYFLS